MNPVCVSTWHGGGSKYFDAFLSTARKHGIEPQNADDSKWEGADWRTIPWHKKLEAYLRYVQNHQGHYTHFLFCDSYDVVFAAGWDEIMRKWHENFDSSVIFGTECNPWPRKDQAPLYPMTLCRSKYLNAGFWMATFEYSLIVLQWVLRNREPGQCDQGALVNFFLSHQATAQLDNACSLFFCCNLDSLDFLRKGQDGRPITADTGQQPCLFHGNGNSPLHQVIKIL